MKTLSEVLESASMKEIAQGMTIVMFGYDSHRAMRKEWWQFVGDTEVKAVEFLFSCKKVRIYV